MPDLLPTHGAVTIDVKASPDALWPFVSDPAVPAQFSRELRRAGFAEGGTAAVGATIEGHNKVGDYEWTTRSTVVRCDAPRVFSWAVGDAENPVAVWSLEVTPSDTGSRLTESFTIYPGDHYVGQAVTRDPEGAPALVRSRVASLLENVVRTVSGIATLAESAPSA